MPNFFANKFETLQKKMVHLSLLNKLMTLPSLGNSIKN